MDRREYTFVSLAHFLFIKNFILLMKFQSFYFTKRKLGFMDAININKLQFYHENSAHD